MNVRHSTIDCIFLLPRPSVEKLFVMVDVKQQNDAIAFEGYRDANVHVHAYLELCGSANLLGP